MFAVIVEPTVEPVDCANVPATLPAMMN